MRNPFDIRLLYAALACGLATLCAQEAEPPPEGGEAPNAPAEQAEPQAAESGAPAEPPPPPPEGGEPADTPPPEPAPVQYFGGNTLPANEPAEAEEDGAGGSNAQPTPEIKTLAVVREPTPEETLVTQSPFLSTLYQARRAQPDRPNALVGAVEFRGAVKLGGEWQFSLYDPRQKRGFWVRMNDAQAPYVVTRYDEQANTLGVNYNGSSVDIPLSRPSDTPMAIAVSGAAAAARTAQAPANATQAKSQNAPANESQRQGRNGRRAAQNAAAPQGAGTATSAALQSTGGVGASGAALQNVAPQPANANVGGGSAQVQSPQTSAPSNRRRIVSPN